MMILYFVPFEDRYSLKQLFELFYKPQKQDSRSNEKSEDSEE